MAETLLKIENLTKEYEGQKILDGINLEVKQGDVLVVVGPSGCGKSTLLRCINALEPIQGGTIKLQGMDIRKGSKNITTLRQKIGMVFQSYELFPHLTVLDNITLAPVKVQKRDKAEAQKEAMELLARVGLADKAKSYPRQLSGGQKQRVAIARALANTPKILLCDEATSALDPTTTKEILKLLQDINKQYGITIVIITHEMAVVQEICSHVAIIDAGQLAEHGTVEEVFSRPQSAAARKLVFMVDPKAKEMSGKRCIRIVFTENSSFEPVIANMVLECKAPVNILLADTKDIGGIAHGQMILQLPEDEMAANKMVHYLQERKLEVEELRDYVG